MPGLHGAFADWVYEWQPTTVSMDAVQEVVKNLRGQTSADRAAWLWRQLHGPSVWRR